MTSVFRLVSTGSALPARAVTNAELVADFAARGIETSAEWIESRTGITQRYIVGEGESTFTLARTAMERALAAAGLQVADVDVLVVATCTPDKTFPSVAALIHGALAMKPTAAVLDINAACSGFIHALAVARGLLKPGQNAVVIGAECFSKIVDWNDRATSVLFGDGAGAVVLRCDAPGAGGTVAGILGLTLGAEGAMAPALMSSGGVATTQTAGYVQMNGREVFKHAVRQMGGMPAVLADAGLTPADVDWVVPHQANVRILEAAAAALGVDFSRVVVTVPVHANTSAASIPLALDVAVRDGRIRAGQKILLQAFGAGFVWSDALVIWG